MKYILSGLQWKELSNRGQQSVFSSKFVVFLEMQMVVQINSVDNAELPGAWAVTDATARFESVNVIQNCAGPVCP